MSSVLAEDFVHRFPEFKALTKDYIELVLDEAKAEIDPEVWGNKYRAGVLYLAADKIALSPLGQPARLQTDNGISTYRVEFERLRQMVSAGFLVA
jgi:hypothetical protein